MGPKYVRKTEATSFEVASRFFIATLSLVEFMLIAGRIFLLTKYAFLCHCKNGV